MRESSQWVSRVEFSDPEMLGEAIKGVHLRPCQLSGHPSPSVLGRVDFGNTCFDLTAVGPAMLYRGRMPDDRYTLTFVAVCPGEGRAYNFEMPFQAGYIGFYPPGAELDCSNPAGSVNAILTVSKQRFEAAMAGFLPEIPERVLARGLGARVGDPEQACLYRLVTEVGAMVRGGGSGLADESFRKQLAHELRFAFLAALRSGCRSPARRHDARVHRRYRRLRVAREFIADHLAESVHVTDLCGELGMSERGVGNLFKDLVGIGPHDFIHHEKLQYAHHLLFEAPTAPGEVKRAALESGFWHLGRFAHDYRAMFGEGPSDTLARHA